MDSTPAETITKVAAAKSGTSEPNRGSASKYIEEARANKRKKKKAHQRQLRASHTKG